ncbi:MAG: hypothetical protein P8179_06455 [Candidatus Thiodiazotropha sp.]
MKYLIALFMVFPVVCFSQAKDVAEFQKIMAEIRRSHIEGNVPSQEDFDAFLKRDLKIYFESYGENISVKYRFLRDGPTQSGVSTPKYYVWVQVIEGGKAIQEGAARVSAVEKKKFDVLDFIAKSDVIKNPSCVEHVFPSALLVTIRQLSGI